MLRSRDTDVVGDSSGRSYVTEQGHNVPLLRTSDIDQCFVTWQNADYDVGEPVDNFINVIDVAFSADIIEGAVMTCDHFAFLHFVFCSHSYCFEHFTESPHLHL